MSDKFMVETGVVFKDGTAEVEIRDATVFIYAYPRSVGGWTSSVIIKLSLEQILAVEAVLAEMKQKLEAKKQEPQQGQEG